MTRIRNLALAIVLVLGVPFIHAQADVSPATLTFTTIDVPGAGFTAVLGINKAGEMVGDYGQFVGGATHGFSYINGTFTYFDYPGETVTVPSGINDSGLIVGYTGSNPIFGFLYDGTTFTTIQDGSDSATYTFGINNDRQLCSDSRYPRSRIVRRARTYILMEPCLLKERPPFSAGGRENGDQNARE